MSKAFHFFQHLGKSSSPSGRIAYAEPKNIVDFFFLNLFLILKDQRNASAIIMWSVDGA